ncbi:MAG: hypothetical protein ACRDZO_01580, partial [Egibacteraceae bacterium]
KVNLWDLQPKFGLRPNGGAPLDPPKGVPAIRRAILLTHSPDRQPPTSSRLHADVEQAKRLRQAGRLKALAVVLPELLINSRVGVAEEVQGAWWCLAASQQTASSLVRTLGEPELATMAADRSIAAAERSGDALLATQSRRALANGIMRMGWFDEAGAVCSDAADAIAPTDETSPEGWSVWGSLQLTAAVSAARAKDPVEARRLLRAARTAAERVGSGRNDYWEAFGPANVGAIEVAVALEVSDPVEALRAARTVEIEKLPSAERRARFCLSVAQAHGLRRDDAATVLWLLEAETQAVEVVRHSGLAHGLVRACLKREPLTPKLRDLAERLGITD